MRVFGGKKSSENRGVRAFWSPSSCATVRHRVRSVAPAVVGQLMVHQSQKKRRRMLLCPSRSETEAAAASELSVGCPLVFAAAVAVEKPPAQRL